jgi:hypothetical protein
MKPTLLSAKELSVTLGISVKSIQRAYRTKEIPVVRMFNMLRFNLEKVLLAMEKKGETPIVRRKRRATAGMSRRRAQPNAPGR